MSLVPVAIFSGLTDVFVVFLAARMFNSFVGVPNEPSVPFSESLDFDPKAKILGLIFLYVGSTWVASIVKLILKTLVIRKILFSLRLTKYFTIIGHQLELLGALGIKIILGHL